MTPYCPPPRAACGPQQVPCTCQPSLRLTHITEDWSTPLWGTALSCFFHFVLGAKARDFTENEQLGSIAWFHADTSKRTKNDSGIYIVLASYCTWHTGLVYIREISFISSKCFRNIKDMFPACWLSILCCFPIDIQSYGPSSKIGCPAICYELQGYGSLIVKHFS